MYIERRISSLISNVMHNEVLIVIIGFSLGILLTAYVQNQIIIATMLFATLFIMLKNKHKGLLCFVIFYIAFTIGVLRIHLYESTLQKRRERIQRDQHIDVCVEGIITEASESTFLIKVSSGEYTNKEELTVTSGITFLVYYPDYVYVKEWDNVQIHGEIRQVMLGKPASRNKYLRSKGVDAEIQAASVEVVENPDSSSLVGVLGKIKNMFTDKVSGSLPQPHASLLTGMVYGDTGTLSNEFHKRLRNTGTTHIIAVSGYNITLWIVWFEKLYALLSRRIVSIFTILFIIFFMLFVGMNNVPVFRSGIMSVLLIISRIIGRKKALFTSLGFTVAFLLLLNPFVLESISFQLSFLSTLGLISLNPVLSKKMLRVPGFLREDLCSTISAVLFTLPVSIYHFQEFSLLSILVNIFVLPVTSYITIGGIMFILSLLFIPIFSEIILPCIWIILEYFVRVIDAFGKVGAAVTVNNSRVSSLISFLLFTLILVYLMEFTYARNKKCSI
jgi:competence protein ComEC